MADKGKPKQDEDEEIWARGEPDEDVWARGTDTPSTEPLNQDWGDAARSGASVVHPPTGPESIAPEPYGPEPLPIGAGEALALAYLSGTAKQGADEATGAVAAGLYGGGGADGTRGEIYRQSRDRMRARMAAAREQHPWLTFGAGTTGELSSDYIAKLLGAPIASVPYQVATGALSGFMGSDADLTRGTGEEFGRAGKDALTGAAIGYTAPIVGRWAGNVAARGLQRTGDFLGDVFQSSGAKEWLENVARERALKAAGYIQKDLPQEPLKRGALLERGQRLLDEPGLITPGATSATIAERLQPLKDEAGEAIGSTLRSVDAGTGARNLMLDQVLEGRSFNPYPFIARARTEILDEASMDPSLRAQAREIRRLLGGYAETAERLALEGKPWTYAMANEMKGNLQAAIFNGRGDVAKNKELANALQRLFIEEIDAQVEAVAGQAERAAFQLARQRYGDFSDALKHATQGSNRDLGNNLLGLGDRVAAETAAAAGGGFMGAAAAALANKAFRGRGDSAAANIAGWASRGDWLDDLAKTNPEALGRFGAYLGAAASRSPEALSVAKYELGQLDPEYQEERRRQGGQQQ